MAFAFGFVQCPIVRGGRLAVDVPLRNNKGRKLRETQRTWVDIDRIQLEIDSGKSHHTMHRDYTLVDLNRCVVTLNHLRGKLSAHIALHCVWRLAGCSAGVALLEIGTQPSMRSADQAGAFLRKLQVCARMRACAW